VVGRKLAEVLEVRRRDDLCARLHCGGSDAIRLVVLHRADEVLGRSHVPETHAPPRASRRRQAARTPSADRWAEKAKQQRGHAPAEQGHVLFS